MEKHVTLLDRAGGLLLMLILWVVGFRFSALGVTFLPVMGLLIGPSLIVAGTWFGVRLMWPELAELSEFNLAPLQPESAPTSAMEEEHGIEPDFLQAA